MLCVYYNFKNKGFPGGSVVGTVPYQGRGARVPVGTKSPRFAGVQPKITREDFFLNFLK